MATAQMDTVIRRLRRAALRQDGAGWTDGQLLALMSDDYTIRLWDITTGTVRDILKGHSSWVNSVVFSPDGQLLASASKDHTVRLWDTATKVLWNPFKSHPSLINSIVFSPDSQLLA